MNTHTELQKKILEAQSVREMGLKLSNGDDLFLNVDKDGHVYIGIFSGRSLEAEGVIHAQYMLSFADFVRQSQ